MTIRLFSVMLTLVVFWVSKPAAAQDSASLFEQGAAMYYNGNYGAAILKFKQAYQAEPNALFLYNMSLCYLKLGQYEEAIEAGELAKKPHGATAPLNTRDRTANDARIAALRRVLEARKVKPPASAVSVVVAPDTPDDVERWGTLGWVGVGVAVLGAGVLGGALLTDREIDEALMELERAAANGDRAEFNRLSDDVDTLQTRGRILTFSGLGVASLGLGLIVFDLLTENEPRSQSVGVIPLREGGAVVNMRVRF